MRLLRILFSCFSKPQVTQEVEADSKPDINHSTPPVYSISVTSHSHAAQPITIQGHPEYPVNGDLQLTVAAKLTDTPSLGCPSSKDCCTPPSTPAGLAGSSSSSSKHSCESSPSCSIWTPTHNSPVGTPKSTSSPTVAACFAHVLIIVAYILAMRCMALLARWNIMTSGMSIKAIISKIHCDAAGMGRNFLSRATTVMTTAVALLDTMATWLGAVAVILAKTVRACGAQAAAAPAELAVYNLYSLCCMCHLGSYAWSAITSPVQPITAGVRAVATAALASMPLRTHTFAAVDRLHALEALTVCLMATCAYLAWKAFWSKLCAMQDTIQKQDLRIRTLEQQYCGGKTPDAQAVAASGTVLDVAYEASQLDTVENVLGPEAADEQVMTQTACPAYGVTPSLQFSQVFSNPGYVPFCDAIYQPASIDPSLSLPEATQSPAIQANSELAVDALVTLQALMPSQEVFDNDEPADDMGGDRVHGMQSTSQLDVTAHLEDTEQAVTPCQDVLSPPTDEPVYLRYWLGLTDSVVRQYTSDDMPEPVRQTCKLVSADMDSKCRVRYEQQAGRPKEGPWTLKQAHYSPSVYLLDEHDTNHPELSQRLAALGSGSHASVAYGEIDLVGSEGTPAGWRPCAIKTTPCCSPLSQMAVEAELQSLWNTYHLESYATCYAVFVDETQDTPLVHFALELCEGANLLEHMDHMQGQKADFAQQKAILCQLAEGLVQLHDQGFAHGDVKPANAMVHCDANSAVHKASLVDLGYSNSFQGAYKHKPVYVGLTVSHAAPEMVRGHLHDPMHSEEQVCGMAGDVWALGCVAFKLFTGTNPFFSVGNASTQALHEAWADRHDRSQEPQHIYSMLQQHVQDVEVGMKLARLLQGSLDPDLTHRLSASQMLSMLQGL